MKAILRKISFPAVALLALGITACSDNEQDINYDITPGNKLYYPKSGYDLDLGTGEVTKFEWAPAIAADGGFVTYTVLFDKADGDFSNPLAAVASSLTGLETFLTITAKELNRIVRAGGLDKLETGKFKWTVSASRGLFGQTYSEANEIFITAMNAMNPLPEEVKFTGSATEDPTDGISMIESPGIDDKAADEGYFECFTQLNAAGTFTIVDDLGRYYRLESNGSISDHTTEVSNSAPDGAGIYWFKLEFDGMVWSAEKVTRIEYYAASWANSSMTTDRQALTYRGLGVWSLLDYDNHVSVNSANDTRHRFNMTTSAGSYFLGTTSNLGSSYTDDYLRVNIYNYNSADNDWNKTYNFLVSDCGRPFDLYLYMNGENPSGRWWHEYIWLN